jgi:hypothetical protein
MLGPRELSAGYRYTTRLGGITIWRLQCTTCRAVFTVLPHFILRYRQMRPEVARDALLATHGGLSLEWCAVLYLTFHTLFSGSMMVFEECARAKRGMVL